MPLREPLLTMTKQTSSSCVPLQVSSLFSVLEKRREEERRERERLVRGLEEEVPSVYKGDQVPDGYDGIMPLFNLLLH